MHIWYITAFQAESPFRTLNGELATNLGQFFVDPDGYLLVHMYKSWKSEFSKSAHYPTAQLCSHFRYVTTNIHRWLERIVCNIGGYVTMLHT